ncbi:MULTISPECIES: hypothetical protein [Nostoc]|uniref:Calx-beta domain-containing protein n=1 Tax=Nostoc paludosum FACHB-159 TaxID=2692908 RepID=A0ABR8K368_9NOSO|nr:MULTISPECIES: hypothetical protein [Nostoc]MBD2678392.1 hypothetical protein [Nostoc sp. FACHB-857]MBD2733510.1 hypothetical protein [Nostoc paludosum FACHB-159]
MKNLQVKNHLPELNCLVHNSQLTNIVNFSNFSTKNQLLTKFSLISSDENQNKYHQLNSTFSYPTIVNITATKNRASQFGEIGEFVITRNGDLTQDLIVKYNIKGTAKYGVDYQPIANFAIVPAGENKVAIIIQPQKSDSQGTKTILLSLENLPHSNRYMLGENFHAVVNILDSSTF